MFEGFSEKTSEFLWGLTLNNEKPWFEAHRAEYEQYLRAPLHDLAVQTASLMEARFPEAGLKLHISRIYRDARRLHGKGPYKEHLWFSLVCRREDIAELGYWFEIGPVDYAYGMGVYAASADQMESYRKSIDANPARMARLAEMYEKQELFVLDGEDYKRPKGDVGELLNKWYNKKLVGLTCRKDFGGALLKPELPQTLFEDYSFLMPYFEFLRDSMDRET